MPLECNHTHVHRESHIVGLNRVVVAVVPASIFVPDILVEEEVDSVERVAKEAVSRIAIKVDLVWELTLRTQRRSTWRNRSIAHQRYITHV